MLSLWAEGGVDPIILAAARPLLGRVFADRKAYWDALRQQLGEAALRTLETGAWASEAMPREAVIEVGPVHGFSAQGWLGQYLVVLPEPHLVAVRMRQLTQADQQGGPDQDTYHDFIQDVMALVQDRP